MHVFWHHLCHGAIIFFLFFFFFSFFSSFSPPPPPPPSSSLAQQPYSGLRRITFEVSRSHTDTPRSVELLWTRDRPVAGNSTWQHTTFTTDRLQCPGWNSNPQSQQSKRIQAHALDPGTLLMLSRLIKSCAAHTGRFWSQKKKQGIEASSFSS
jgi:hypothetical protein